MTPIFKASVTKDRLAEALKDIQQLTRERVLVGIPQEHAQRRGEPMSNATLGYIHERGAPEVNIPARPFLVPGIESIKDNLAERFRRTARGALKGDARNVRHLTRAGLESAGMLAVSAVKRKITIGPFEPLQPSTIRARNRKYKSRKARTASDVKPLISTGQLRNSINFVIRSR